MKCFWLIWDGGILPSLLVLFIAALEHYFNAFSEQHTFDGNQIHQLPNYIHSLANITKQMQDGCDAEKSRFYSNKVGLLHGLST